MSFLCKNLFMQKMSKILLPMRKNLKCEQRKSGIIRNSSIVKNTYSHIEIFLTYSFWNCNLIGVAGPQYETWLADFQIHLVQNQIYLSSMKDCVSSFLFLDSIINRCIYFLLLIYQNTALLKMQAWPTVPAQIISSQRPCSKATLDLYKWHWQVTIISIASKTSEYSWSWNGANSIYKHMTDAPQDLYSLGHPRWPRELLTW